MLGRAWGMACGLTVFVLLAHHLSRDGFGRYTFYLALFLLLDGLTDLGTGQIATQRTAHDPAALRPVLSAARRIRLSMAALAAMIVGGGAWAAGETDAVWIAVACLYPFTHSLEISSVVFRNRISWGVPVAIRSVSHTLRLGLVLILIRADVSSFGPYLVCAAVAGAVANISLHFSAMRLLQPEKESVSPVSTRAARGLLRAALPLGLASLCQQAYLYIDNVFVRAYLGDSDLAYYNATARLFTMGTMIAVFATQAALPWFASEHAAGRLSAALARLGQPLFAAAGLGAGLVLPWTEPLLESLFGEGFEAGGASLRWLLGAAVMVYSGSILMTAVVATGRSRALLLTVVGGLVTNVVGNLWAVPRFGIEGAAMATLATETFVAVFSGIFLAQRGVRLLEGDFGWLWFGGPVLFIAGASLSALAPFA